MTAGRDEATAPARTDVCLVDLATAAEALLALEAVNPRLSDDEEARLAGVSDPAGRAHRRAAYVAVRLCLERRHGPAIARLPLPRDEHGRPALPTGFAGSFSLSHAAPLVAIAVSEAACVGIDCEAPRVLRLPAERRAIMEAAAEALSSAPLPADGDRRMLQAWVRLEALAKADGRGIGNLLTRIGAVGTRTRDTVGAIGTARTLATDCAVALFDLDVGVHGGFAAVACAPPGPGPVMTMPADPASLEAFAAGM